MPAEVRDGKSAFFLYLHRRGRSGPERPYASVILDSQWRWVMGVVEGKVAVVTGGNRGIGRAVVEALAKEGARVVVASRTQQAAAQAAREVGGEAIGLACDVRQHDQVVQLFDQVARRAGGADILINNAGIGLFA